MKKKKLSPSGLAIVILCLIGGCILMFPAFRFSACLFFVAALVVACYQLLKCLYRHRPAAARRLRRLLTAALCVLLLAAIVTGSFVLQASRGAEDDECDYLIVLGAGVNGTVPSLTLKERLDGAYTYLTQYPDALCVVSGGQGPGEEITEAARMFRYLTERGISADRILLEEQATSTQENLQFSLSCIASYTGVVPDTVAIVSSEYHLCRAGLMAQDQGLDPILIPARTSWLSLRINYYLREIVGVWHYIIFGG